MKITKINPYNIKRQIVKNKPFSKINTCSYDSISFSKARVKKEPRIILDEKEKGFWENKLLDDEALREVLRKYSKLDDESLLMERLYKKGKKHPHKNLIQYALISKTPELLDSIYEYLPQERLKDEVSRYSLRQILDSKNTDIISTNIEMILKNLSNGDEIFNITNDKGNNFMLFALELDNERYLKAMFRGLSDKTKAMLLMSENSSHQTPLDLVKSSENEVLLRQEALNIAFDSREISTQQGDILLKTYLI